MLNRRHGPCRECGRGGRMGANCKIERLRAALRSASIMAAAAGALIAPSSSGAQEIPQSSLAELFAVTGHPTLDPARDPEPLPRLSLGSLDGSRRRPAEAGVDDGVVMKKTAVGTVAGHVAGLLLFFGCDQSSWCGRSNRSDFVLVGAAALAVGGSAVGASAAGADLPPALVGSALGTALGGGFAWGPFLFEPDWGNAKTAGSVILGLGIHAAFTTLFALRA